MLTAKMFNVPKPEDLPSEAEVRKNLPATMPEQVKRYYEELVK